MKVDHRPHDQNILLVVEDDPAMLVALRDILEGDGYRVITASNGQDALEAFSVHTPSLILSDISMPVMDGIQFFEAVRKTPSGAAIPFIFLTARGTREDVFAGKSLGADDYIAKPITSQELLSAIDARLRRSDELEAAQLKEAYKSSLRALANAIEARDQYTRQHVERVNAYAQSLARELDWSLERRDAVEFGAILHDIGKIAVRESILTKKGPLNEEEWEEMRQHPTVGAHMIEDIPYLAPAVPLVRYHHERWNGSGYPEGLRGEAIPSEARLLAIVDTYDAVTSDRPYRQAAGHETAYGILVSESDRLFDPNMVEAFTRCWHRGDFRKIAMRFSDGVTSELKSS